VDFFSVPCCEAFSESRLNGSDFACVGFLSGAVDAGGSYSPKRVLPLLFINTVAETRVRWDSKFDPFKVLTCRHSEVC
jgi:hypothetical protein